MKKVLAVSVILWALAAGCSGSGSGGGSEDSSDGAPHAAGKVWLVTSPNSHGTAYKNSSLDCRKCHELERFCVTCHFGANQTDVRVPSGSNWVHGLNSHGAGGANLVSGRDVCVQCHTAMKSYTNLPARTGSDCVGCHGYAMHDMPYEAGHQSAALANLLTCRQCHDTPSTLPNFDGYVSGKACSGCHPDAKAHPYPWYDGHRTVAANWPTVCAICHNTQSASPATGPYPNAPSCFSASFDSKSCHAASPSAAPHALGKAWLDPSQPTFHGSNIALFKCSDCHDQNTFCSTCHFGPSGAKVPPGVAWDHGRYPHALDPSLVSRQAVCNQCHTLMKSYSGKPTRVDCANCHGIPSAHGSSFIFTHTRQEGMDLAGCQRCHGRPGTPQFGNGVAPLPDCSNTNCHGKAKGHPTPWRLAAGDAVSHMTAGNIPTACGICHDTVIDGTGTTPLQGAPPCRTCHPGGFIPHEVPFKAAEIHGPPAKENLNYCQGCHSDNPTGGPGSNPRFNVHITPLSGSGLSHGCEDCHTAGGAHATNWQGQDGNKLSHRTAGNLPSACSICHGADLTGSSAAGVTRPSCFSASFNNTESTTTACHFGGYQNKQQFHPDLATWVTDHQPIAVFDASRATCYECHDLAGTTYLSNVEGFNNVPGCRVCHFDELGSRVPAGVDWIHGSIPHGSLTQYADVCNACHSASPIAPANVKAVTCTGSCHAASHPFGAAWMDKKSVTFHGIEATPDPSPCAACHGNDFQGGWVGSQTSCYRCHFNEHGYKLPTAQEHGVPFPSSSHQAYAADAAICNACHQTNRQYGNASPAVECTTQCHAHPMGQPWMDKTSVTFHGLAAAADPTPCAACHGDDYRGGTAGAQTSCYRCHFSPQGWKSPAAANHVSKSGGTHFIYSQYSLVCNACHDTNRTYGNPPPGCHDCHPLE